MVTFYAWSQELGEKSPVVPSFALAAVTRPGQMPDCVIVERDEFHWTWWTRDDEGEWIPEVGGTHVGMNSDPSTLCGGWAEPS